MFTQKPPKYNADSFHLILLVNWLHAKGHTKIRNVLQHTWKTQATVLLLRVHNRQNKMFRGKSATYQISMFTHKWQVIEHNAG
jgi:hypothetical protein